jgi:LytR cell envelope-related transcriptional attenuator
VTDFLKELELQMTAAAHRAVAERARPPRAARWPTLAFMAVSAVAIAAMFLLPARPGPGPAKEPFVSLENTSVGVYNAAGIAGLASPAGEAIHRLGPRAAVGNLPQAMRYSVVLSDKAHAAQARRVARTLGIERFGAPRPLADGRSYDVVVLLGKDFAAPAPRLLASFAFLRESLNRWVETPAGRVRVIASRAGLCLLIRDGAAWAGPCVDVRDALAGKAVASIRRPDGRLRGAAGLVPDGVAAVELGQIDGTSRRLPVGRNLWAVGAEPVNTVAFDGITITVP